MDDVWLYCLKALSNFHSQSYTSQSWYLDVMFCYSVTISDNFRDIFVTLYTPDTRPLNFYFLLMLHLKAFNWQMEKLKMCANNMTAPNKDLVQS